MTTSSQQQTFHGVLLNNTPILEPEGRGQNSPLVNNPHPGPLVQQKEPSSMNILKEVVKLIAQPLW